jgi:uncharacterized protein (TIGR02001 family)
MSRVRSRERAGTHGSLATIVALAVVAAISWPGPGHAQSWHGSLAATSDYVYRGISQTQGDGAVQADLHYQGETGGFAGAWASSVDDRYDALGRLELDLYAGWNWQLAADWTTRLAYVRYLYPDATGDVDYEYGELSARLAWRDRAVGSVAWSPDAVHGSPSGYGRRGNAFAYELVLRQPLGTRFGVTLGGGWYEQYYGIDYGSWNVGLDCQLGPFGLALARFATTDEARATLGSEAAGARWAFTALWRF